MAKFSRTFLLANPEIIAKKLFLKAVHNGYDAPGYGQPRMFNEINNWDNLKIDFIWPHSQKEQCAIEWLMWQRPFAQSVGYSLQELGKAADEMRLIPNFMELTRYLVKYV